LLSGGHYDVPERIIRGIWPHPPLRFDDLVEHLSQIISTRHWFPHERKAHTRGEAVNEFGVLERVAPDHFIYHAHRGYAHDPFTIAESCSKSFSSARDAARYYLKWSLHLPGDLDSWKVV
jgi:hypothetical protein